MEIIIDNKIISDTHKKVIHFLVDYFEQQNIEYQFTGGFAGNLYGSIWKLQDIDIEVNLKNLYRIENALKSYVIKEIHRYNDHEFEIWLLQINIENVEVDINAVEDFLIKPDIKLETKIENAVSATFESRLVRVQSLHDIIEYKKLLGRDKDLNELNKLSGERK